MSAIDTADAAIIEGLRSDGRSTYGRLGELSGLSDDVVAERVRRLIDRGVVKVVGVVDPAAVGYRRFALVGLVTRGPLVPIAEALSVLDEMDFAASVSGRYDLIIELVCRDDLHLAHVLSERIRAIPGVAGSTVLSYLHVAKWAPEKALTTDSAGLGKSRPLDDIDIGLLRLLQRDGRATFRQLADELEVSYAVARRRAQRLLDEGTIRITTVVDRAITERQVLAGVGLRTNGPVSPVLDALAQIDQVEIAAATTGPFDIVLEVACRSEAELFNLVGDRLREVEGVRSTETWTYLEVLRLPASWDFSAPADAT